MTSPIQSNKTVSIIMPVYNGSKFLSASIDSILSQTFEDFEFIIIDDGSTDNSLELIKNYKDERIKLFVNEKNMGVTNTLNKALKLANCELIARHDCDDIALPTRLAKQVDIMSSKTEVVCVGAWMELIDKNNKVLTYWKYPKTDNLINWKLLFNNAIGHPVAMFRKSNADKLVGYSNDFKDAEDYEFWARMSRDGEFYNLPEVLIRYRVHENSISQSKIASQQSTQTKISNTLIQNLLDQEPNYNYSYPSIASQNDFLLYREKVFQLFKAFRHKRTLDIEEFNIISEDIDERLRGKFADLSFTDQLKLVLSIRSRGVNLSYVKQMISADQKEKIKGLFK